MPSVVVCKSLMRDPTKPATDVECSPAVRARRGPGTPHRPGRSTAPTMSTIRTPGCFEPAQDLVGLLWGGRTSLVASRGPGPPRRWHAVPPRRRASGLLHAVRSSCPARRPCRTHDDLPASERGCRRAATSSRLRARGSIRCDARGAPHQGDEGAVADHLRVLEALLLGERRPSARAGDAPSPARVPPVSRSATRATTSGILLDGLGVRRKARRIAPCRRGRRPSAAGWGRAARDTGAAEPPRGWRRSPPLRPNADENGPAYRAPSPIDRLDDRQPREGLDGEFEPEGLLGVSRSDGCSAACARRSGATRAPPPRESWRTRWGSRSRRCGPSHPSDAGASRGEVGPHAGADVDTRRADVEERVPDRP
jgi:hypothetical protein